MVCKNEQAVYEKKNLLVGWVTGDPTNILKNAKRLNTSTPYSEYIADISGMIKSKFVRGCGPDNRSLERERIIVRYVVYMHLQMMDRSDNKKSPLISHRNMATPVEASTQARREDSTIRGPAAYVIRQLKSATSFFDSSDRVRVGATNQKDSIHQKDSIIQTIRAPFESSNETDWSRIDWTKLRVANLDELRNIHHRLLLRLPFCEIHLYHHPMEIYMAWGLHEIPHVYENHGLCTSLPSVYNPSILPSSTYTMSDIAPVQRFPNTLMVVRPGSYIYDESFQPTTFKLPIDKLIMFMWRNGHSDSTRSMGWRIDIGNGGQAFEQNNGAFRPKTICGTLPFESDQDGEIVRVILGKLVDGISKSMKLMSREMEQPLVLNERRYNGYAQHLQEYFYAEEMFVEHITIQMLDLSAGHSGVEHKDVSNDRRASYNSTAVKVMNFLGPSGNVISLKIICSFRKRIGDFYSVAYSKIEKLLVNISTMLEEVNVSYRRLWGHHRGCIMNDSIPTWDNVDPLFLNERSPWEIKHVTPGITQRSFQTLTGIGRNLWLSSAWTQINRLSSSYDERGMIQMLMVTAWQNTFQRFWEVCIRMDRSAAHYPLFEYYRVARELFYQPGKEKGQEMMGGDDPRFVPIGFDFKSVFLIDGKYNTGVVDRIVDYILGLCDSINALRGKNISLPTFLELVETTAHQIRGDAKCELGSFRLMILLQGCVYLGIRLEIGTHLRDIFFPVRGSGSWNHLLEVGIEELHIDSVCREIQLELSTHSRRIYMDEVEVVLCESKHGRLLQKHDTFIFGQDLFQMNKDGVVLIKKFGENTWKTYVPQYKHYPKD